MDRARAPAKPPLDVGEAEFDSERAAVVVPAAVSYAGAQRLAHMPED